MFLMRYKDDEMVIPNFLLIQKYIKSGLLIEGNYIYLKNGDQLKGDKYFKWSMKDRFGVLQDTKIVKYIKSQQNVYEIRINEEYLKHRLLFFPFKKNGFNDNKGCLALTFAFSKSKDVEDLTDKLALETQCILDFILNEKLKFEEIF